MRSKGSVLNPEETYVARTPRSRALHEEACEVMPGGTTRTSTFFTPYPVYIERGEGCRIWDVDGTERIDLIGNYSALILGHRHPRVVEAMQAQLGRGTAFAAANAQEVRLAQEICGRVPSVETVRFTNSGTEATMFAMRLARAVTGRQKIARMEGGYHGTHDFAEVSGAPDPDAAGPADDPLAVPNSIGTPSSAVAATVVLPFNNLEAAERILRRERRDVAGVIVEPIMGAGGVIPAEPHFLRGLRDVTTELGMPLIFDEVISLRVSRGGAQEAYGVMPDLTTMGKIIGGGLPIAAFGGRAALMGVLDPRNQGSIPQGGTYNGNPLGMVAGLATLGELTPQVYQGLARKGDWLRTRLKEVFAAHAVEVQITGVASLFHIHFTSVPVRDYRTMRSGNATMSKDFFLGLLNHGVMLAPRGMGALSVPMTDADLETVVTAVDAVVTENKRRWAERSRARAAVQA